MKIRTSLAFVALALVAALSLSAQDAPKSVTVFSNVRIFDGKKGELSAPSHVLVRGNLIEKISSTPIPADRRADTVLIECGGRTLMPGLIDAHAHVTHTSVAVATLISADEGYIHIVAAKDAAGMLARGFTSIRDAGGPSFPVKRAIDEGLIEGPRIWPSGAAISQSGGHGDYRARYELPRSGTSPLNHVEKIGGATIADGVPEVLRATREQLMLGASQIKLLAGGGVASAYDPLDVTQYTEAEIRAAVDAAANWGTYVTVHAYTPESILQAIKGGVKCIEHGQLINEPVAKMMAKQGIWWCLQPFLDDEEAIPFPEGSANRAKQLIVLAGTDKAYALAKKYKVKTAFGTDTIFDAKLALKQGKQLAKLTRWYAPAEVLKMATADNAELLALSGPRNPYPGKLGVVEEGALADLLLVDGDPIANIKLIEDPAKNFVVIMKDGKIFKNTVK